MKEITIRKTSDGSKEDYLCYEVSCDEKAFSILLDHGQEGACASFFSAMRKKKLMDSDIESMNEAVSKYLFDDKDEKWVLKNDIGEILAEKF